MRALIGVICFIIVQFISLRLFIKESACNYIYESKSDSERMDKLFKIGSIKMFLDEFGQWLHHKIRCIIIKQWKKQRQFIEI